MRIESVRIQNFRAFSDETIALEHHTCFVGANGAGKSTVLYALNVFFRSTDNSPTDPTALRDEDFHKRDTSQPARITVTFCDLSSEAKEDFKDYVRQDKLTVSAVATYDEQKKAAPVIQVGERLVMKAFAPYFAKHKEGVKVAELAKEYEVLQLKYPELKPAKTKDAMTTALQEYEAASPGLCELLASSDEFYGFSKGANRLARYVQWVYVPAVKDVATEQLESKGGALGKLLARTVRSRANFSGDIDQIRTDARRKYQEVLAQNQGVLDGLSQSLGLRLSEWSHPEAGLKILWQNDERSIRVDEPLAGILATEGIFEGELVRFGHGLQRSYLLALLQELSSSEDNSGPTLILACEEPELFQHPPQERYLAGVLRRLSVTGAQVILCTHSPHFVSGREFESVRMVRKHRGTWKATVSGVTHEAIAKELAKARGEAQANTTATQGKLYQELQPALNEMFFTPVLVLVEGAEDVAYVTTYLSLLGLTDEYRRLGCHMVPAGGKSHLIQPRAVAKHLAIPTFTLFDADGHQPDKNGTREKHRKDNTALLRLCGYDNGEPFPSQAFWAGDTVVWDSEMGQVVERELGARWTELKEETRVRYSHVGGLEKNSLFIGDVLSAAWNEGLKSQSLERLCGSILTFAKASSGP